MIEDTNENQNKEVSKRIIQNIENTMTDHHIVEKKQNKMWAEKKSEIVGEDRTLNEFFCGLHPILQFSEVTEKMIREYEKEALQSESAVRKFQIRGESGTQQLMRMVAKLFFKDGTSDPLMVKAYLEAKGIDLPITDLMSISTMLVAPSF